MQESKVSIIMATYNRAHFILETLASIRMQTYQNWECVIIDDGSTDTTQEVLAPVLQEDQRIKYFKRPESYLKGLPGCRNYGLDMVTGDYVVFFDDDDLVHHKLLETSLKIIEERKDLEFCHYQKQSFEGVFNPTILKPLREIEITPVPDDFLFKVVSQQIGMASCTVLWKSSCFSGIRFNESLQYAEEWECYIRILLKKPKGVITDAVLYFNRKHPHSNTGEYWKKDPIRRASKKRALYLVALSLSESNELLGNVANYLIHSAIHLRDRRSFDYLVGLIDDLKRKLFFHFKYLMFPIWKFYKTLIKNS